MEALCSVPDRDRIPLTKRTREVEQFNIVDEQGHYLNLHCVVKLALKVPPKQASKGYDQPFHISFVNIISIHIRSIWNVDFLKIILDNL